MAAAQIFKVLTEFKFEVASATINASNLQGATDRLASSADKALVSKKTWFKSSNSIWPWSL